MSTRQALVGVAANRDADVVAVAGAPLERLQDQEVERALQQLDVVLVPAAVPHGVASLHAATAVARVYRLRLRRGAPPARSARRPGSAWLPPAPRAAAARAGRRVKVIHGPHMKRLLSAAAKERDYHRVFSRSRRLRCAARNFTRNAVVRRVPLPLRARRRARPIPPWLDRLLILVPDNTLIWRNVPNVQPDLRPTFFSPVRSEQDRIALLRRFTPTLPAEFRGNPRRGPSRSISHGYRTAEYHAAKTPGTIRVACIGDSWTFGMNVDQDRTYQADSSRGCIRFIRSRAWRC